MGGMGSVYRARDLHFPNVVKLVAVKEMINAAPDPLVRQTIVQNFEREANMLATLNHPSIPRIYDYFTLDDRSYLVIEFIHGKDLETVIADANGFLPEDQVISWAIQLCDVLSYLHAHKPDPIIFRDMKPSNVMINHNGDVVLVDFGIAKTFQSGQKGTMIGTEGYSPPEQYRGEATPLADIYSLGATLHHAITRRDPRLEPPFSFSERPVRRINPNVSVEFEAVINVALQYNPADRFPNADTMKEALMNVARKTGTLSKIASALPVATSGTGIKPLWSFKCEDEIRGTPTLHQGMLFIGCYDNNLYALNAADGQFQWKYATEGGIVTRPTVYDNNVIFGSEDKRLHVVGVRAGKVVWTYYTDGKIYSSPHIADGHIFFGSEDQDLHAVNVNSGRAVWKYSTDGPIYSTPVVANEMVFFGNEAGGLYAVDFRGTLKWRFQSKRAITSSPVYKGQAIYFSSVDGTSMPWMRETAGPSGNSDWAKVRFHPPRLRMIMSLSVRRMALSIAWTRATQRKSGVSAPKIRSAVLPLFTRIPSTAALWMAVYTVWNIASGRLRWKFETKAAITGSPVVFDDIVYFGSTDHHVYALFA